MDVRLWRMVGSVEGDVGRMLELRLYLLEVGVVRIVRDGLRG